MVPMAGNDEITALRAENARLISLLEAHGIESRAPPEPPPLALTEPGPSRLTSAEKVALFRRLFGILFGIIDSCFPFR